MADGTFSPKRQGEVRPRAIDFKSELRKPPEVSVAETIVGGVWSVTADNGESPIMLALANPSITGTVCTTEVAQGTTGVTYTLICHITTSLGMEIIAEGLQVIQP